MINFLKKLFGSKENLEELEVEANYHNREISLDPLKAEEKPQDPNDEKILSNIEDVNLIQQKPIEKIYDPKNYHYPELLLFDEQYQSVFPLLKNSPLNFNLPVLWSFDSTLKDLADLKNILVIGTQATGKTTFLHQLIISLLLKNHPSQIKLLLADSKGVEFQVYKQIEKQFLAKNKNYINPIIKDTDSLIHHLNALCIEMANRYDLLRDAGVRNISEYNTSIIGKRLDRAKGHQYLPFLILIIDDLGGFFKLSEINQLLVRILSEGYKVGIVTILSTNQTGGQALPTNLVSMITHRVAFRLNSKEEYRRFLDTTRLEIPLTSGSFLYNDNGHIRLGQTYFFTFKDIENLVEFIGAQSIYPHAFILPDFEDLKMISTDFDITDKDPLFEDAARLIVSSQSGSTSLLQRRMKLGYNRSGRLMDQLEAAGIVGPNQGSTTREVLIKTDKDLQLHLNELNNS